MRNSVVAGVVVCSLGAGIAIEAYAQEKPENYIRFRKANQQVVNWHMRQLGAIAKAQRPMDVAEATRVANVVSTLAPVFATGFPTGTDQGDTRARPEIWAQPERFKQLMDNYAAEAAKLVDVAKSGNADNFRGQFGTLVKACDACHDDFRRK